MKAKPATGVGLPRVPPQLAAVIVEQFSGGTDEQGW